MGEKPSFASPPWAIPCRRPEAPRGEEGSFLGSFLGVTRKPHTTPRGPSRSETASSRSWWGEAANRRPYRDLPIYAILIIFVPLFMPLVWLHSLLSMMPLMICSTHQGT